MLQNPHRSYGVTIAISTILLVTSWKAVSQSKTTGTNIFPTAEAFVPPAPIRGTTQTISFEKRTFRSRNNRECCIAQKCRQQRIVGCLESCSETDAITGETSPFAKLESTSSHLAAAKKANERIPILAKCAASLVILATSLAVAAPMPAIAESEASFLPDSHSTTVALPFSSSPIVLADAAPYTGQLVDTSNAVLVRLDSGVTYNDLREGTGDGVAMEGKRVNIQWVLKRSNGYSIDSSAQNDGVPFIFVVGNSQVTESRAIPGLDEGIRGMRVGGIRRIVIPPSLAYVEGLDDGKSPGPVPPGFGPRQRIKRVMENRMDVPDESFLLDIKLTRVQ